MRVFISLASYKDKHLLFTLQNAWKKSTHRANVFFAVVDQGDADQRRLIGELPFARQVRYVHIDHRDSLGVCWARNLAFSLYDGEDYFLQVDSHTCFEQGWDAKLIEQHAQLMTESDKPVISTYPKGFVFDDNGLPSYQPCSGRFAMVLRPQAEVSLTEQSAVLRFRCRYVPSDKPLIGCHVAAGFIFSAGNFIEEVPYDPYLYFHGEEQSLAVRAYTRGWDIYHPTTVPLYHLYKKRAEGEAPTHWSEDEQRAFDYSTLQRRNEERLIRLFYGDGMPGSIYGLGNARTLDDYIAMSGIDYRNRLVHDAEAVKPG